MNATAHAAQPTWIRRHLSAGSCTAEQLRALEPYANGAAPTEAVGAARLERETWLARRIGVVAMLTVLVVLLITSI